MNRIRKLRRKILFRIVYPFYLWIKVMRLKRKKQINIVFIAMSLSMWRYQRIYELLSRHPRFKVSIVILPCMQYSEDQQNFDINTLKSYFDSLHYQYYVGGKNSALDIRKMLSPDILFYPQPYPGVFSPKDDYFSFRDLLLCYSPYAFWDASGDWSYNELLHNYAWKLFYATELHRKEAQKIAYNKGRNVEVVGYSNTDNFLYSVHKDVWKLQTTRMKRVIWAPHFSIFSGGPTMQSNFLWMAESMLELTERYAEKIQFAFKPHPRLLTELCKHVDWGKERANRYYNEWRTRKNTQLETGEFVDLFMTSDAMIHDSGSFSVEYHYSGNPVLYIADNFEQQVAEKGELGKLAMHQHYVGKCKEDITRFIEEVVLNENDPMKEGRKEFYNQFLLPPNGKSVAENTMDVFLNAFC